MWVRGVGRGGPALELPGRAKSLKSRPVGRDAGPHLAAPHDGTHDDAAIPVHYSELGDSARLVRCARTVSARPATASAGPPPSFPSLRFARLPLTSPRTRRFFVVVPQDAAMGRTATRKVAWCLCAALVAALSLLGTAGARPLSGDTLPVVARVLQSCWTCPSGACRCWHGCYVALHTPGLSRGCAEDRDGGGPSRGGRPSHEVPRPAAGGYA